jgi:hypothetical protein
MAKFWVILAKGGQRLGKFAKTLGTFAIRRGNLLSGPQK